MTVKCIVKKTDKVKDKTISYDGSAQGFLVTSPHLVAQEGCATLVVSDFLGLTVGTTSGTIYEFDGLAPKEAWEQKQLTCHNVEDAIVTIIPGEKIEAGMGYNTLLSGLPIQYDSERKILCIGGDNDTHRYRIFQNLIIGLKNDELNSVWVTNVQI